MVPKAEISHWLFASLFLLLGLILLAETIVGTEVFRRRRWRAYLWPSLALTAGVMLWVVVIFSTFSTMHLLAHAAWAEAAMIAGGVQLAVVAGSSRARAGRSSRRSRCSSPGSRSSSTSRTPGSSRVRHSSITQSAGR